MAVLGNCPSTGVANFGSTSNSPIKYVYMNEVSTTAAAYALAGFVDPTKTSQTGLDEFHIGYANTTQALKGIQNAILTAQNLYDITGSDISTTYAGEGHIARATTVGSNATTTGTVPQSLIDTIGDILAACVDSNNTIVITGTTGTSPVTDTTSGTLSAQCQTLFQYATDNGIHDTTTYNATLPATGHQPYNIAQAALSMARFPQGFGIGTTTSAGVQSTTSAQSVTNGAAYVAALYALPTGNPPFSPSLLSSAAPDSFAIPITYTNSTMLTPYRDAIDSQGNVWVVGNGQNYALKFNNLGVQQYALTGVDSGVSVAIDQSDNAWVTSNTNSTVQEFSSTGSTLQTGLAPTGIDAPYAIAVDGGNNVWVGNETGDALIKMTNAGVLTTSFTNTAITTVEGMAFDNTGAVWIAQFTGTKVAKINAADNAVTYNPTGNGLDVTARVVVDSSNNAWFESSGNATLEELSSTDTVLSGTTGYTVTGGAGTNPEGLGIDGNDNLYECFAGTTAATSAVAKFTNAGKYVLNLTTGQNGSRGCQIDPSGNLWVVENQIPSMIEYVGIATPVVTPTSIGVKNSTLGTKP